MYYFKLGNMNEHVENESDKFSCKDSHSFRKSTSISQDDDFEPSQALTKRSNPYSLNNSKKQKVYNDSRKQNVIHEDEEEIDSSESSESPKSTKSRRPRVQKIYEPIVDNEKVYRYEDDPSEYKRARKRIQNRESATRVRNKKKVGAEQLKEKIGVLEDEILNIKSENAFLNTENTMLKDQLKFLQKVLVEKGKQLVKGQENLVGFMPKAE